MFMMTTQVDGGRDQQTRNRHLNFNSQRTVDYNHHTDFGNPNFSNEDDNLTIRKDCVLSNPMVEYRKDYARTNPMIETHGKLSLPTGKPFIINHQDEGYGTDSKSNTSPSTASPLSSSFSSLSTSDGSFNSPTSPSGGVSPNSNYFAMHGNTQRCSAPQKPSLIQGNGKIHVNRHALVMAKKKDSPQDMQENPSLNLEDRLRALTTIEEEETGLSNVSMRETYKKEVYDAAVTEGHNSDLSRHLSGDGRVEESRTNVRDQNSGFFRAVPVDIAAPQSAHDQMDRVGNRNNPTNSRISNYEVPPQIPVTSGHNSNDKNWYDYRRYFEKDSEIPLHNIDALNRGKFVNAGSANDKDINRQLETNAPQIRGGQDSANASSNGRQPGDGRDAHGESNESFGNDSIHAHRNLNRSSFPRAQFHEYSQNGQRVGNYVGQQNAPSSSVPDLSFPHHLQTDSIRPNDHSHHSNPHSNFRHEEPHSHPQPHHQNQYIQPNPFYNESSQQYYDAHLSHSQNRPSDSFNSLPRNYEDQRQQYPMFYSENQRDLNQLSENDVVLRRSWASSSTRAIPDRIDRYSWQPETRPKQPSSMGSDRYSLDLGNIPQLQQQIRATSEMCLQASKRHKFASSADIYKLFQGQKKPITPSTSLSSSNLKDFARGHRHSFHNVPGGSWTRSQQNLQDPAHFSRDFAGAPPPTTHPKQHGIFSNHTSHPSPSPGPLRGDHSIPLPQTSWTSNSFLAPNSLSSSSTFPLTSSELPHIQRQSSGYSSENELQQIEQNAKAVKKAKTRNGQHSQQGVVNSDQEFVPVDPNQDHDSSSSMTDNEPVYVNQPMLANARGRGSITKSSPIQQSQFSTPPPPPLPARPKHLQPTPVVSAHDSVSGYDATSKLQNSNSSSPAMITQKQIIHFNQKSVTINSYIPNQPFNSNPNNTNGQMVNDRHILPGRQYPSLQQLEFQSNSEKNSIEQVESSQSAPKRSNSSRSHRANSSPCTPLSPLEIAQVLDAPFATSVISDESGDRLSTLV